LVVPGYGVTRRIDELLLFRFRLRSQPLQAFDAGGRARTVTALVQAFAKESGVDVEKALGLVNWDE
jgi:hypothetical protein